MLLLLLLLLVLSEKHLFLGLVVKGAVQASHGDHLLDCVTL